MIQKRKGRAWKRWVNACVGGLVLASTISCQKKAEPTVNGSAEDAPPPDESQDTGISCDYDSECSDGAFCNGQETCYEGTCHLGEPPSCDDGIECTVDSCSHTANGCVFSAPDEDRDGHLDANCEGPDGAPLGDDCDDEDGNRYPGNTEVCGADDPTHDEDCDPTTFGYLDADLDGVVSAECCNSNGDEMKCGKDCDDGDYRRYPKHPEICDDIDNDCDGEVDVNTKEVPWYPDGDGDNFGEVDGDSVMSCAPVEGRSLRPSDCDDGTAAIHIAATEACDGLDNDCDGETDEDNVCACAPEGNARPCACGPTRTGVQICTGGLWNECNCNECMDGEMDCIAGILPRLCVDGQWEFQIACTGQFSECNDGVCTCPGGGTDCPDTGGTGGGSGTGGSGGGGSGSGPSVVSTNPADLTQPFSTSGTPGVEFNVDIAEDSVNGAVVLYDAFNNIVPGTPVVSGANIDFVPSAALLPGMGYRLEILANVTDTIGNPVGSVQIFDFYTASGLLPVEFSSDTNLSFTNPILAMSPNRTLRTIVREETKSPPSVRTISRNWNGAGWDTTREVTPDYPIDGWEFDVDDNGWMVATAYDGMNLALYDYQGSAWTGPTTASAASGSSTRNLVALNGAGRGFYVFENTSMSLELVPRTGTGSFETAITTPMFGDFGRAAAINPSGAAAVATISGTDLFVWHSGNDLTGFVIDSIATNPSSLDVAVGGDGKKYVAYSRDLGVEDPQHQVFIQVRDTAWMGEIDAIASGSGDEFDPQIGVDGVGNAHLLFRKNGVLTTVMLPAGGNMVLGDIHLSTPNHTGLGPFVMEVASNGDVVVVWTEGGPVAFDLWSARYTDVGGWATPRRLEDTNEPIGHFDLAIDDTGYAVVTFEISDAVDTDSMTVVVP